MKQLATGQYLYSPSDLIDFLECNHATYLSIKNLSEEIPQTEPSPLVQMLRQKGFKHETDYLQSLKDKNQTLVEIPTDGSISERAKLTAEAMRSGADIIYQAALYKEPKQGIADFLIKCKQPSSLGNYSYEVLDVKFAKTAQPKHIIQLCVYSELVADIQGTLPSEMHLLLGNREESSIKVNDCFFYYGQVKRRFENYIAHIAEIDSRPEPCPHCDFCKWQAHCTEQWQQNGHLKLVAGIQRRQIEKLRHGGINTIDELAAASPDTQIKDLPSNTFKKLHIQAKLQDHKAKTGENKYEIMKPRPNKGFAPMPPPNPADLYFDIEGDPFYPDTLAYLFGIYYTANGEEIFKAFWGHDREQEKESFEKLMHFMDKHLTKHPDAHIYHFGRYEIIVLQRISHRCATQEALLDKLIQTKRFIDLYDVVRNGIYISESGYTLKHLETFYMKQRSDTIIHAIGGIVAYYKWRETQEPQLLQEIADYNKMDCRSTYLLHGWLRSIRPKEIPWCEKTPKEERRADWAVEYEDYQEQLGMKENEPPIHHQRLAHLLEFHNREAKPKRWDISSLQKASEYDLADDPDCLVELQQVGKPRPKDGGVLYTYLFPRQECTLKVGSEAVDIEMMEAVGIIDKLDKGRNIVKIRTKANGKQLPQQLSIGMSESIDTSIIRSALYRYANHLINNPQTPHVATELLMQNPPRIKGKKPGEDIIGSGDLVGETLKAVTNLDHSYLFIQGPPGSGKTHICSQTIVELIRQGKKIGISSNSHQAIHHVLERIEETAIQKGIHFSGIKKASLGNDNSIFDGQFIKSETSLRSINLNADLYAGTAWTFSSRYFDKQLDYLFIDEAGQVSTANVIAMSNSTKNIILVGDHMQLSQPIRGIHPQEAGLSILELLLDKHRTIPADRGIFLSQSYRLRPSICYFISNAFYEGRLTPHEITHARKLHLQDTELPNEGIVVIDAQHENCSNQSSEEAEIIKNLYQTLLGQTLTEEDNTTRRITANDILIVTPYNSQVDYLYTLLPDNARIGTVDKFQGQEAPIVLVSMVSSSTQYLSPKIVEFLYSKNRLNVALSRAQCLAIVIASPRLMEVTCSTVEQIKLVNTYCQLNECNERLLADSLVACSV